MPFHIQPALVAPRNQGLPCPEVQVLQHFTERALIQRINRALTWNYYNRNDCEWKNLKTCRENSRWFSDLGRYYMVDLATNFVCGPYIADIEDLAREMGLCGRGK